MALIQCEECGKNISSNAAQCIHCGNVSKPPVVAATGNLMNCKSCAKPISPKADSCIHCGHIYKREKNAFESFIDFVVKGFIGYVLLCIFIIFVILNFT